MMFKLHDVLYIACVKRMGDMWNIVSLDIITLSLYEVKLLLKSRTIT